jgi:beta-glucosidase
MKTDKGVKVSVNVKNTGAFDGEEVVQLYIKDHYASLIRPVQELKSFEKVMIKKGEQKVVEFVLTDKHLGFYNAQGKFIVEPGAFDVMVGGNSRDVLKDRFELD